MWWQMQVEALLHRPQGWFALSVFCWHFMWAVLSSCWYAACTLLSELLHTWHTETSQGRSVCLMRLMWADTAAVDVFISSGFLEVQQKFFINPCRSITRHRPTSHFVSMTKLKAAARKRPYNNNTDARMKKYCFLFSYRKRPLNDAGERHVLGGPNKEPTAPSSGVSAVLHTCSYITNKSSSYNEAVFVQRAISCLC